MKSEAGQWLEKQGRSSGGVVGLGKEGVTSSSLHGGEVLIQKKNQYFLGPYLGQKKKKFNFDVS